MRPGPIRFTIVFIAAAALIWVALSQMRKPEQVSEFAIEHADSHGEPPSIADPKSVPAALPPVVDSPVASTVQPVRDPAPEPDGSVSVHGQVKNASGAGLPDIEILVESLIAVGGETPRLRSVTDQRGEFRVAGLVPETQYRLTIEPQQDYGGYRLDSFNTGQPQALANIVLPRIDLVDVDGMIVDTNRSPLPDFELTVRSLTVEFPDRVIRSDSSGYFRLESFPAGELRIATNASDYFRIKGLELRPDEYVTLTLVVDMGNYHLSGWVSDDNGAPLAETQVTVKSAFRIDAYHSFSYRSTVTDENGAFEFTRLGGYPLTIAVYANGFETYIRQHEFETFSDSIEIRLRRQG